MWYKGKMVLSVASYNFLRWHKNARVVTAFLLDFILCYLLTDKAVQFAVERDTTMQIFEAFIWTFGDSNAILLVSLLLLILFADMPFITTATPFYLMRTTRRVGCGADGVCGAGHYAFHGIYTFFHGGADHAECFRRQPVEPDSGGAGLFRQRQRTESAVSGESYRDEPAMAEYALGIGTDAALYPGDGVGHAAV